MEQTTDQERVELWDRTKTRLLAGPSEAFQKALKGLLEEYDDTKDPLVLKQRARDLLRSQSGSGVTLAKARSRALDAFYAAFDRAMSEAFPGIMRWDQLMPGWEMRGISWDTGAAHFVWDGLSAVKEGKYRMSYTDDWGREEVALVEGPFDMLKLPDIAVASFGPATVCATALVMGRAPPQAGTFHHREMIESTSCSKEEYDDSNNANSILWRAGRRRDRAYPAARLRRRHRSLVSE